MITFCITHFANLPLLEICLDSIKKFHPNDRIIVSQQLRDEPPTVNGFDLIYHEMRGKPWSDVATGLLKECQTDIAVFIEHDAFLLKPLDSLVDRIKSGEYDMIGPEEVIPLEHLDRNAPGMICQNFFMINAKKIKELGLDKIVVRGREGEQNRESGHGMSQTFDKKLYLPVIASGYGYGTYYGDHVHHLWYGSFKKRPVENDGVNKLWMEFESERVIKDYKESKIRLDIL